MVTTAATRGGKAAKGVLQREEDAGQVDADDRFPFREREVCNGAGAGDAGRRDDGIQAAELRGGLGDGPGHAFLVTDVACDADRPPAISRDLADDAVNRVPAEIGDGHRSAVLGQQRGARAADTTSGTGHDGAPLRQAMAQNVSAGHLAPVDHELRYMTGHPLRFRLGAPAG